MSDSETVMVRFGADTRWRPTRKGGFAKVSVLKSCMVTVRRGDCIYYGISRCNKDEGDVFDKQEGLKQANERVQEAMASGVAPGKFDRSVLSGCVTVSDALYLVKKFRRLEHGLSERAAAAAKRAEDAKRAAKKAAGESTSQPL